MNDTLKIGLCLLGIIVLVCLVHNYNKNSMSHEETFDSNMHDVDYAEAPTENADMHADYKNAVNSVEVTDDENHVEPGSSDNEVYASINSNENDSSNNQLPADCYPKDQLSPSDLLPQDPNSTWAQVNPSGQGDLKDQNFLNAGYHVGINTVGQTLRNANMQLRSEPPNPQVKVSPWQQTTIEPDTNRRAMEIGGCE